MLASSGVSVSLDINRLRLAVRGGQLSAEDLQSAATTAIADGSPALRKIAELAGTSLKVSSGEQLQTIRAAASILLGELRQAGRAAFQQTAACYANRPSPLGTEIVEAPPPIRREPSSTNPVRVWTERNGEREHIWVETGKGKLRLGMVETIEAGARLYHWSSGDTLKRWFSDGITPAEMSDRLNENIMSMGGGLYVSTDPYDSREFGTQLLVFETPKRIRTAVYERIMGAIEELLGVSRVTLNHALREAGVGGIRSVAPGASAAGLKATWLNLLDESPLESFRRGTLDDLAHTLGLWSSKPEEHLSELLELDGKKTLGLAGSSAIERASPALARLIRGGVLTRAEHEQLWPKVRSALTEGRAGNQVFSPKKLILKRADQELLPALRREFAAEINRELRTLAAATGVERPLCFAEILADPDPARVKEFGYRNRFDFIAQAAAVGLEAPEEVGLAKGLSAPAFMNAVHPLASEHWRETLEVKNSFGLRLLEAFSLGPPGEILDAIERGAMTPWETDSLRGLRTERLAALERAGSRASVDQLRLTHAMLTRADFVNLTLPTAGDNPRTPLRGTRRFEEGRVTAEEARVLQGNPLLSVELSPDPAAPGGATVQARWEYPSAATWRKFETYLPAGLVGRLKAAALVRDGTPEFERLTREVIQALLDSQLGKSQFANIAPLQYQLLEAIQPFEAQNEPVIRAFVSANARTRLVMDPRRALTEDPDAFALQLAAGVQKQRWLMAGFAQAEKRDPGMPRFYDAPELKQVARDTPEDLSTVH